jgi:hypothetical protein
MQVDNQDRFYNEILDLSTKNSSANNTLFSKERIETLIGGVKQAKDATKPSGKENVSSSGTIQLGMFDIQATTKSK